MGASAPVGVTRLSENIVLWRDADGQVHALEDRCPHRGARLTLGWALGDRVACWYHGVEVRHDGVVPRVPAQANAPMEGKRCVRSYHVREAAGAIRSEEHTSELQSLMRISYAVFCLKKKTKKKN